MIEFIHDGNEYKSKVIDFPRKNISISTKYDTGSGITMFSVYSTNKNAKLTVDFFEKLKRRNISILEPKSATGHLMKSIVRCKKNVTINNVVFERFYYYWYLNDKLPKALIGDDLIRFCKSKKDINDSIIIEDGDFDMQQYLDYHKKDEWKKALMNEEIIDEVLYDYKSNLLIPKQNRSETRVLNKSRNGLYIEVDKKKIFIPPTAINHDTNGTYYTVIEGKRYNLNMRNM